LFYAKVDSALEEARDIGFIIFIPLFSALIFPLILILNVFFGINILSFLGFEINMYDFGWVAFAVIIGIVFLYKKMMRKKKQSKYS
jgi:hypothetical protein